MKARLSLKPGQKGTKQLVERFGTSLLYVRYRYDEERGVRLKTVELVVEEKPWRPTARYKDADLVPVVVGYGEKELRQRLKAANGTWDPEQKLWHVPYGAIKGSELEGRIQIQSGRGKQQQASHIR